MTTKMNPKSEREYYIDWLRIILILSVFLFHIGMIFNTWPWHIKNNVQYAGFLRSSMIFLHNWRMPLLFMLSGAGTWFALGRRTPGEYLKERFKRLFIPFLIGIFTLVPVQVYIEKIDSYNSLFNFYGHMFDGVYPSGNFSWHHLWFILYLFFIALLISPFLNILRSPGAYRFRKWCDKFFSNPVAPYTVIFPLIISQLILRAFFEPETHSFFNDWATITYYVIFFISGFFLLTSGVITDSISRFRFLHLSVTVIATIIMFFIPGLLESESAGESVYEFASVCLAWSCAMTATGFAKTHMNFNSKLRSVANEAIYPFYLLHQPVIVITGYFIINMNLGTIYKLVLILIISFSAILTIYRFVIKPFNFMRMIFGLKLKTRQQTGEPEKLCIDQSAYEASRA